jgi:hypothetical protein
VDAELHPDLLQELGIPESAHLHPPRGSCTSSTSRWSGEYTVAETRGGAASSGTRIVPGGRPSFVVVLRLRAITPP